MAIENQNVSIQNLGDMVHTAKENANCKTIASLFRRHQGKFKPGSPLAFASPYQINDCLGCATQEDWTILDGSDEAASWHRFQILFHDGLLQKIFNSQLFNKATAASLFGMKPEPKEDINHKVTEQMNTFSQLMFHMERRIDTIIDMNTTNARHAGPQTRAMLGVNPLPPQLPTSSMETPMPVSFALIRREKKPPIIPTLGPPK